MSFHTYTEDFIFRVIDKSYELFPIGSHINRRTLIGDKLGISLTEVDYYTQRYLKAIYQE